MEIKEGIIVKAIDYQDNSKILTIMTKEGKETYIAKGAKNYKSKTFAFSQEITQLQFNVKKQYITSAKIMRSFPKIKSDVYKLRATMNIIDMVYQLSDHINNYQIFYDFFSKIINLIEEKNSPYLLELIFKIKLTYLLGIAPNFKTCVVCNSTLNLCYFSLFDGGMKCGYDANNSDYVVSEEELAYFKELYYTKITDLEEKLNQYLYMENLNLDINKYYEYFLGFKSNTEQLFKKIFEQ